MKVAIAVLALTGCSQLLGLEDTTLEQRDAMVDAPSSCDAAPRCTSTTGRSVCGQLYGAGATAGQILRAAEPTGETCTTLASTTGPCAYTIYGQPLASYYAGAVDLRIAGDIDDCGRYTVLDLDVAASEVALVFTGPDIVESVTLVARREAAVGEDRGVVAPLIPTGTPAEWATQVDPASPPTIDGGYLVTYVNMTGAPIATQELRVNGGAVADPPTVPWGAYFAGDSPYGAIDPAATATGASGSAVVVPSGAAFMLGGFRTGKNCTPVAVQPKPGAFIHIALGC